MPRCIFLVTFTAYLMNCCFMILFTSAFINYRPKFYDRMISSVRWLCNRQMQIHIKNMFCVNFIGILIILLSCKQWNFSLHNHVHIASGALPASYPIGTEKAIVWSKHSFHPGGKIKELFQIYTPYIPSHWMMAWHRDSSPSNHLYIHLTSSTNKPVIYMQWSYKLNYIHLNSSINKAVLSMWWVFTFNRSYKLNSIK